MDPFPKEIREYIAPDGNNGRISKERKSSGRNIGVDMEKKIPLSVPYEEGLYQRLKDPKFAAGYLMACLESGEPDAKEVFLLALRHVAKAQGFKNVSLNTGLGRESLYKSISGKGDPKISTLFAILDALGLRFSIEPAKRKKAA